MNATRDRNGVTPGLTLEHCQRRFTHLTRALAKADTEAERHAILARINVVLDRARRPVSDLDWYRDRDAGGVPAENEGAD